MQNNWKEIWNKRNISNFSGKNDIWEMHMELKRINGFDVLNGGLTKDALQYQYEQIKKNLSLHFDDQKFSHIKSIYEIGCGNGANLYLFENEFLQNGKVGGCDYSENLIALARKILKSYDIECIEAKDFSELPVYDAVLSNSVFSYFPDFSYAEHVLEKACKKAKFVIGLLDLHDQKKENAFIDYRKKHIENYEERYKNLPKLFYSKEFFIDFAKEHDMYIHFTESDMPGYWNNAFVFNCYLYTNETNRTGLVNGCR